MNRKNRPFQVVFWLVHIILFTSLIMMTIIKVGDEKKKQEEIKKSGTTILSKPLK